MAKSETDHFTSALSRALDRMGPVAALAVVSKTFAMMPGPHAAAYERAAAVIDLAAAHFAPKDVSDATVPPDKTDAL